MDFELTPEEKAFQKEVREFLDRECNENVVAETLSMQGAGPYSKELLRKMGAAKLLCPKWPVEYGGRGMGVMKRQVGHGGGLVGNVKARKWDSRVPETKTPAARAAGAKSS